MGSIASASTVYATAYLTELGRKYLFNSTDTPRFTTLDNGQTIDRLKITRFSLGDTDVNYRLADQLESGDVPDLSGENETAIKGTKGRFLDNLISPGETSLPKSSIDTVEYRVTQNEIVWDMAKPRQQLPAVVTQQLMTFIDGLLVTDGIYNVSPTNYGKIEMDNNELIIPIREPNATQAGYRLRIFFPKTGSNYNKMVFQFEKSNNLQQVVVRNVNTQTISVASQADFIQSFFSA